MAILVDGNSTIVTTSWNDCTNTYKWFSQSFTTDSAGQKLLEVYFWLKKSGSPTGSGYAKLYAMSGTFGSTGQPTGTCLATSDAFDVSTLTTSDTKVLFSFSGEQQYEMEASTHYCIVFTCGSCSSSNKVQIHGGDTTHGGNSAVAQTETGWVYHTASDYYFEVYRSEVLTANPEASPTASPELSATALTSAQPAANLVARLELVATATGPASARLRATPEVVSSAHAWDTVRAALDSSPSLGAALFAPAKAEADLCATPYLYDWPLHITRFYARLYPTPRMTARAWGALTPRAKIAARPRLRANPLNAVVPMANLGAAPSVKGQGWGLARASAEVTAAPYFWAITPKYVALLMLAPAPRVSALPRVVSIASYALSEAQAGLPVVTLL